MQPQRTLDISLIVWQHIEVEQAANSGTWFRKLLEAEHFQGNQAIPSLLLLVFPKRK